MEYFIRVQDGIILPDKLLTLAEDYPWQNNSKKHKNKFGKKHSWMFYLLRNISSGDLLKKVCKNTFLHTLKKHWNILKVQLNGKHLMPGTLLQAKAAGSFICLNSQDIGKSECIMNLRNNTHRINILKCGKRMVLHVMKYFHNPGHKFNEHAKFTNQEYFQALFPSTFSSKRS